MELDLMNFLLKLPNKRMEEYSKIILFIPFHSIPFPPSKEGLRLGFDLFSYRKFRIWFLGKVNWCHKCIDLENILETFYVKGKKSNWFF